MGEQPEPPVQWCIFSTNLGERKPRAAINPPKQTSPAGVIVRSDPAHGARVFAQSLQERFPQQCYEIYAGWQLHDFFDPYDIHLHGAPFLHLVLNLLAGPNNQRVIEFAHAYASQQKNIESIKVLAACPIHTFEQHMECVVGMFDRPTIDQFGARMLVHVVLHLKSTMVSLCEHLKNVENDRVAAKAQEVVKGQQHTAGRSQESPYGGSKGKSGSKSGKKKNQEKEVAMRHALNPPAQILQPPPVVPDSQRHLIPTEQGPFSRGQDLRRTISADHESFPGPIHQRGFRNFDVPPPLSRAVSGMQHGYGQLGSPLNPSYTSSPATGAAGLHLPKNAAPTAPFDRSPSINISTLQPLAQTWEQPAHPMERPGLPPNFRPQMPGPDMHLQHEPFMTMTPKGTNVVPMLPAPQETYQHMQPPFAMGHEMVFQNQIPVPVPSGMPFGAPPMPIGHPIPYGHNEHSPMLDATNRVPSASFHSPQYNPGDKFRSFGSKERTDNSGGRGGFHGQQRYASNAGRGRGGHSKANFGRKFSNDTGPALGGDGSSYENFSGQAFALDPRRSSFGHPGPGVRGGGEPFPNLDPTDTNANPQGQVPDPDMVCTQTFIGQKRNDIFNVFVAGFPMDRDPEVHVKQLSDFFRARVEGFKDVEVIRKSDGGGKLTQHAFANFESTANARAALALHGDDSLGYNLTVYVPKRHYDPYHRKDSKSGNYTPGYRRNSNRSQGRRNSLDPRGPFGGEGPVFFSNAHVQALSQNPRGSFGAEGRRFSGFSQSESDRNARTNGLYGASVQRIKIPEHQHEDTNAEPKVCYSPQDCRSGPHPVKGSNNTDVSGSPERKKKKAKSKRSDDSLNATAKPFDASALEGRKEPKLESSLDEGTTSGAAESTVIPSISEAVEKVEEEVPVAADTVSSQAPKEETTAGKETVELAEQPSATTVVQSPEATDDTSKLTEGPAEEQSRKTDSPSSDDQATQVDSVMQQSDESFHSAEEAQSPETHAVEGEKSAGTEHDTTAPVSCPTIHPANPVVEAQEQSRIDPVAVAKDEEVNPPTYPADDKASAGDADDGANTTTAVNIASKDESKPVSSPAGEAPPATAEKAVAPIEVLEPESNDKADKDRHTPTTEDPKSPVTKNDKASKPPAAPQGALHPFAKANQPKNQKKPKEKKGKKKDKKKEQTQKDAGNTIAVSTIADAAVAAITTTAAAVEPVLSKFTVDAVTSHQPDAIKSPQSDSNVVKNTESTETTSPAQSVDTQRKTKNDAANKQIAAVAATSEETTAALTVHKRGSSKQLSEELINAMEETEYAKTQKPAAPVDTPMQGQFTPEATSAHKKAPSTSENTAPSTEKTAPSTDKPAPTSTTTSSGSTMASSLIEHGKVLWSHVARKPRDEGKENDEAKNKDEGVDAKKKFSERVAIPDFSKSLRMGKRKVEG